MSEEAKSKNKAFFAKQRCMAITNRVVFGNCRLFHYDEKK